MKLKSSDKDVKEVLSPKQVLAVLEHDLEDIKHPNDAKTEDKGYDMLLPFEGNLNELESNKVISTSQLSQLKIRDAKDAKYRSDYVQFMNDMFEKEFAEPVPAREVDKKAWYIPHHGVYHPHKKKMREGPNLSRYSDNDTSITGSQAVSDEQKSADEGSSDDNIYFKSRNFSITPADAGVRKHVNVHAVVTEQCLDLSRLSCVSGWCNRIKV